MYTKINQDLILNQQQQHQQFNLNPSCIVIGCKNGNHQTNPSVKYYQVPSLAQSNQIARQWYINTLREDLLDLICQQTNQTSSSNMPHYVCIEHFDEESFLLAKDPNNSMQECGLTVQNNMIMMLKDDAVPSLFEIEVFQKMIAHQEQFAINQQQKLQLNVQQIQTSTDLQSHQLLQQPQTTKNSLLQNLILNIEPQQTNLLTTNNSKRTRIDPDFRAALIQRVPKAVKRTALIGVKPTQQQQPTSNSKLQKAIKHTFPRQVIQPTVSNSQQSIVETTTSSSSTANKIQKAVKHTSSVAAVNSLLKELLPPPIMQSTKRAPNSTTVPSTGQVNKAVKHTCPPISSMSNSTNQINNNKQPLTILNVNNTSLNASQPVSLNPVSSSMSGNKITITTTYVYKRVSQQPEIDLNLECEEEELVYIKAPAPPPPRSPSPASPTPPVSPVNTTNVEPVAKQVVDKIKDDQLNKPNLVAALQSTDQQINKKLKDKNSEIVSLKKEEKINPTCSNAKITPVLSNKQTNSNKDTKNNSNLSEKPNLTAALTSSLNSLENKTNNNNNTNMSKNTSNLTQNKASSNKLLNYTNVLAKFYSRRLGALNAALLAESSKNKTKTVNLPLDLRIGNYPAKCNVCDIVLENNIELTSHICSHLESNGQNETEINTYISPFDAVTTTCGVCDTKFSHPFYLIRHLDTVHMKQLTEFKCRICEKQHDKLNQLIEHLNENHSYQEMPYRCDACGFRTSFYADAIYHIKKEHASTLRHFCPYCLKSLVLPYNKKLGYVQCNLFYSHLITHFNKHENNQMIPSKCKHCTKCILHVRHMKEHLIYDHNSLQITGDENQLDENRNLEDENEEDNDDQDDEDDEDEDDEKNENNKDEECNVDEDENDDDDDVDDHEDSNEDSSNDVDIEDDKSEEESSVENGMTTISEKVKSDIKTNKRNTRKQSISKNEKTKNIKTVKTIENNKKSIRKRKRSINDQENQEQTDSIKKKTKGELQKTETDQKLQVYDFEQDLTEASKPSKKNADSSVNAKPISKTKRRSSKCNINSSEYSNLIKKAQSIKSTKKDSQTANQSDSDIKLETEIPTSSSSIAITNTPTTNTSDTPNQPVYKKRQKALKQTNIKPSLTRRKYRNRTINYDLNNSFNKTSPTSSPKSPSSSSSTSSNQLLSALLFGNLKFSCVKSQFKCIECGESDLKSHYRTDYECHQCRYNTSCSKSFEYHLHGHLVSKRVALWNKNIKIQVEEYKCPCGFTINSAKDNNFNANTGNKIAEHLLNCEYKYCYFKTDEVNSEADNLASNKESKSDDVLLIVKENEKQTVNTERFNQSDEIIINDSIEEMTSF